MPIAQSKHVIVCQLSHLSKAVYHVIYCALLVMYSFHRNLSDKMYCCLVNKYLRLCVYTNMHKCRHNSRLCWQTTKQQTFSTVLSTFSLGLFTGFYKTYNVQRHTGGWLHRPPTVHTCLHLWIIVRYLWESGMCKCIPYKRNKMWYIPNAVDLPLNGSIE